jgi:hypothetical protein
MRCSAQVFDSYEKYVRTWSADISLRHFFQLYFLRQGTPSIKIPKAIDAWFAKPRNDDERQIKALIDEHDASLASRLEQEVFKQKKRLADATAKIELSLGRQADLKRTEPKDRDARIFPMVYAPVIIMESGRRLVVPMRYQCRPKGKPASCDRDSAGTYNARRDNWKVSGIPSSAAITRS